MAITISSITSAVRLNERKQKYTCVDCGDNFTCEDPDEVAMYEGMCASCVDNREEYQDFPDRDWSHATSLLNGMAGTIMQSTRNFGCEIEAEYRSDNHSPVYNVLNDCHKSIGVCEDAGAEFQTPPASGDKAEAMLAKLCASLIENKFYNDGSTGLHIHIDSADLGFKGTKNLWLTYIVFDRVIRSFINKGRRTNSMCRGTKDQFEEVRKAKNQDDLEAIWYDAGNEDPWFRNNIEDRKAEPKDSSRYRGINMHSIFHDNHLEVRYHEGTIKSQQILEWANLHCLIMDAAKKGITTEWLDKWHGRMFGKRKALFNMIGLSEASVNYWKNKQKLCAA